MYQTLAWQLSLILMATLLAVFLFVASRARERVDDYVPLVGRAYRLRTALFWAILLIAAPVMLYSLVDLPYANAALDRQRDAQVIDVVGRQWFWELSSTRATVGTPVEFRVTSGDVNHGLGIYDGDMRLVAQTMAMPEYTNTLRHTFTRPGTYRLLCLEYCGLIHHGMIAELQVGDANPQEHVRD
ncbi:MAG: cytochrome c oxidase subunit II [Gammaproteobacteria bacterium]|jgi:cytochrome c oxidase subunit 2|nr:cytochrome c oxidase subunit II [Gammaproteobacteria bacterium]